MHPSEKNKSEVTSVNGVVQIMNRVKERTKGGDISGLKMNIQDIKSAQQFVEGQLPVVPAKATQNKYGYYSPAHALDNTLFYISQTIESDKPAPPVNVEMAADQAIRIAGWGMKKKDTLVPVNKTGGIKNIEINRTNVVDIPADWKFSDNGKIFLDKITKFIVSRNQGEIINTEDILLLTDLQKMILVAYDGKKLNGDVKTYPMAREIIFINLALLKSEVEKSVGQKMSPTAKVTSAIQLIRGLYHHNTQTEQEQKRNNPLFSKDSGPTIIDQPDNLRT